jgi:hypothetical protein
MGRIAMKFIVLLCLFTTFLFSESLSTKKRFYYPPSLFINDGLEVKGYGGIKASQSQEQGIQHTNGTTLLLPFVLRTPTTYFLTRTQTPIHNIENYSYIDESGKNTSTPGLFNLSYTFLQSALTLELYGRGATTKQKFNFINVPYHVYPATKLYRWREGQFNLVFNEAVNSWLMVRPMFGVRYKDRNYTHKTNFIPDGFEPFRYSEAHENLSHFNHQSGIQFHFKLANAFRLNLTTKAFFEYQGRIDYNQVSMTENTSNRLYLFQHSAKILSNGNEQEIEAVFLLGSLKLFVGYNYTVYAYRQKKHLFPFIFVTNPNLSGQAYFEWAWRDTIREYDESRRYGKGTWADGRDETLRYAYIGASYQF